METTVRDSVGGIAQISILNTSYFWPDDVAHMESETKSETVPLLWIFCFLAGHLQLRHDHTDKKYIKNYTHFDDIRNYLLKGQISENCICRFLFNIK